jgi:hypothetical protein
MLMKCSECDKEASVLVAGRCLKCNDAELTADLPHFDISEGQIKLLAFLEKLCKDNTNGVITLASGRRLIAMPDNRK